jgi:hypothetical protein
MKKLFTILVVALSISGLQNAFAGDVITLGTSDPIAATINAYTGSASDVTVIVPAGYTNPEYTAATPLAVSLISIPAVIKNLTIQGDGTNPTVFTTTFNLPATSLTSFTLKDLTLKGAADGVALANYLIGGATAEAVATVNITGCSIANFRGIVRMRTGVNFSNLNVDNCIIRNTGSYCILVTEAGSTLGNYTFRNSTVYGTNTSLFGVSASLPTTLTISDCTFDNIIYTAGKYFIDFGAGTTTTLTISNTIIGKTANAAAVKGIRGGTGFTYTVNNSYITSDCLTASPALTGFTTYANTAATLFTTPTTFDGAVPTATVGCYKIKDASFSGIAGDPRWINCNCSDYTAVITPKASSTAISYNGTEISLNETQDIAIYGVTGQLLQSAKQVNKLSVTKLPQGIYAAKAGMTVQKFIVR